MQKSLWLKPGNRELNILRCNQIKFQETQGKVLPC
jgi:hypothetical protein